MVRGYDHSNVPLVIWHTVVAIDVLNGNSRMKRVGGEVPPTRQKIVRFVRFRVR